MSEFPEAGLSPSAWRRQSWSSGSWSGYASNWPLNPAQPVLVLVHCAGFTANIWRPLLALAEMPLQWLAVDMPGHGSSKAPPAQSVVEIATRLRELIEHLELQQVMMAGHSLGGAVTLQCLHQAPGWLKAGALIATGARLKVSNAILTAVQVSYAAYLAGFLMFAAGPKADKKVLKRWVKESVVQDRETALADFNLCNGFDLMAHLEEIQRPVLVVHGDEDKVTPLKYGEYLAEQLGEARLARLKGLGHMLPLEAPDLLREILLEFAQEHLTPA